MARFKAITTGSPVVMGRRTWESFPPAFRPLPGRVNIVITGDAAYAAVGATVVPDLGSALAAANAERSAETVWVIGGGRVYREALGRADVAEVTEIDLEVAGDTTAPELDPAVWVTTVLDPVEGWHTSRTGLRYRYRTMERAPLQP